MEYWTDLPWWLRMTLSLIVLAVGGLLLLLVISGDEPVITSRRGGPLMIPGMIILLGLIMFATSFPYDRNKYNF